MRWNLSNFSSSLMGLLQESTSEPSVEIDAIREAMMDSIGFYLNTTTAERPVWRKLLQAKDIQSLWYLRSDLMHVLSEHCGEGRAALVVRDITLLFRGHIPRAQFASARCEV